MEWLEQQAFDQASATELSCHLLEQWILQERPEQLFQLVPFAGQALCPQLKMKTYDWPTL